MPIHNPYQAPDTNTVTAYPGSDKFSHLSFKEVKKLSHRSSNVGAITAILAAGGILFFILATLSFESHIFSNKATFIGIAVFCAAATVGLFKRTPWGRIMGIITSILLLFNIPVGTFIGIVGLSSFLAAPELFGKNRFTHKNLKQELKIRKINKKNGLLESSR